MLVACGSLPESQPITSQGINTQLSPAPAASSAERPWGGMTIHLHDWHRGGSASSPVLEHDIVAMRVSGQVTLNQRRAGKTHRSFAVPGNITIHPRGLESNWSWDRPGAIVLARVPHAVLLEAGDATLRRTGGRVELHNCFGERDEFMESIMYLFAREVRQPPHGVQKLIGESLSCALAAHLVQRFNVRRVPHLSAAAGLPPQALRRVLDYLHASPSEPVSLQSLADLAGVSRFHFARMFRRSTGESPMAYFERTRLLRAQELIRSGRHTLTQIAADSGFADQAHFTRRFRRLFGSTPSAYSRQAAAAALRRD